MEESFAVSRCFAKFAKVYSAKVSKIINRASCRQVRAPVPLKKNDSPFRFIIRFIFESPSHDCLVCS